MCLGDEVFKVRGFMVANVPADWKLQYKGKQSINTSPIQQVWKGWYLDGLISIQ